MNNLRTDRDRGEAWRTAALVLLAFIVRFLPALVPHFWSDEIYSVAMIHWPFQRILDCTAIDAHPPLFYYWAKCVAAAGNWLGGPCATLAWLRLASILPGVLTCLLAWGLARRHWGRQAARWTLALFALSPALTFYSVELRNYSLVHLLLLAGLIGFLGAADPRHTWRGGGVVLYLFSAIAAFYVHSLSTLFLAVFGLVYLAELVLQRPGRLILLQRAGLMALVIFLACIPWIWCMPFQTARMNSQLWLAWAGWGDLPSAFFWYLPFGPLITGFGWRWMIMTPLGVGMALLLWNARRRAVAEAALSAASPSFQARRLPAYLLALTTLPILLEFLLSHYHIAKVYLAYRYGLMAAPFFNLLLAYLLWRIPRPGLRRAMMILTLIVSGAISTCLLHHRTVEMNGIQEIATFRCPKLFKSSTRIGWTNPIVLPWLGQCGGFRLEPAEQILAEAAATAATPGLDCYFVTHSILGKAYPFTSPRGVLLEKILAQRKFETLDISDLSDFWARVWHLRSADLRLAAADLAAATRTLAVQRNAIRGGQVLLPDDPIFDAGQGWGILEYDTAYTPQRWTEGARQVVAWDGPEQPGKYRIQIRFYRANPFPDKVINVRYRMPGRDWAAQVAGEGWVVLQDVVTVKRPRQALHLELEAPTWVPAKCVPGSGDPRSLGMVFTSIELRPVK